MQASTLPVLPLTGIIFIWRRTSLIAVVNCGGQNATPAAFLEMFSSSRGRGFSSRGRTPATPPGKSSPASRARYWQGKLSARLSICLSVMLRYRGHIGWNSAKIILRLISLTFSLSADCKPQRHVSTPVQRENPTIISGIR